MKLEFGLLNGRLAHISKVENGLNCGCLCPACKTLLVAKKGKINKHHFAHKNTDCNKGIETALHLMAKDILQKHMKIKIPKYIVYLENYGCMEATPEGYITADRVTLEKRIDDMVPDVIFEKEGKKMLIEIAVTHSIDHDKLDKIKKHGFSVLEVYLDDHSFSEKSLEEAVIHSTHNKKWIYSSKEQYFKKKLLPKAKRMEIERQNEREKMILEARKEYEKAKEGFDIYREKQIQKGYEVLSTTRQCMGYTDYDGGGDEYRRNYWYSQVLCPKVKNGDRRIDAQECKHCNYFKNYKSGFGFYVICGYSRQIR
jgi:competence CoiA-like predicted nuclease